MNEIMQNKTGEIGALLIRPAINITALTPEQRTNLGYQLENGNGILEQDYELARLTYLSAAADGNAVAMNNLGWLYHNGMGVEADDDKARSYFEQAADKGCTLAMINLGNLGEDAEDYEDAYKWYRMAYALGDIRGQFNYANMYYWGWYVPQDYAFAFRLFYENAHDWNDAEACWGVGHMLQEGLGIEKDEAAAAHWFARGEELGDSYCATELGRCYCLGLGVEKNDELGLKYYLEGAERGDSLAYANLGYAYEIGQGVAKSEYLALSYYEKGAELGEEHCLEAVERLKPSDQSDDEIFLGHIGEIGDDLRRVADILMHCANSLGIKTSYSNGPLGVYTTEVFNIAPRNRAHEEYVRLEHKISKLAVTNRLSEKRVEEMFAAFKNDCELDDKTLSVKRGYVYLDAQALTDDGILMQYIGLIREAAKSHLKPRTKVPTAEELWTSYHTVAGTIENPFIDVYDEMENEPLENAIAQFYSNHSKETYEAVIEALAQRVREGGEVMCPVEARTGENGESQVWPLAVQDTEGKRWMAMYTNMKLAAERAGEQYLARISMRGALRTSQDYPDIEGIALNPCEQSFNLTHDMIKSFLEHLQQ